MSEVATLEATLTPASTFTTAILITADIILEGGADVFIFQCTAVLSVREHSR
jgi:hypothetical protein